MKPEEKSPFYLIIEDRYNATKQAKSLLKKKGEDTSLLDERMSTLSWVLRMCREAIRITPIYVRLKKKK